MFSCADDRPSFYRYGDLDDAQCNNHTAATANNRTQSQILLKKLNVEDKKAEMMTSLALCDSPFAMAGAALAMSSASSDDGDSVSHTHSSASEERSVSTPLASTPRSHKAHRFSCLPGVFTTTKGPSNLGLPPIPRAADEPTTAPKTVSVVESADGPGPESSTPREAPTATWVPETLYLDAAARIRELTVQLERLRYVHDVALEQLGTQADKISDIEHDLSTAKDVVAAQATMLANIESIVAKRVAAAVAAATQA